MLGSETDEGVVKDKGFAGTQGLPNPGPAHYPLSHHFTLWLTITGHDPARRILI